MIKDPGFYDDIAERDYHLDPCPLPSLSASIAKLLVNRSPLHAMNEHPRLNKAYVEEEKANTRPMDIGTAAHKLFLGKGREVIVIPFDDYRKDAAKLARDKARMAGHVPILQDDMGRVELMVEGIRDQLAGTRFAKCFSDGKAEVTAAWQDRGGVWCRIRLDYLPDYVREGGHVSIADLKTTSGSAHADDWQSIAFDKAYDYSSVLYPRGLKRLIPNLGEVEYNYLVVEQEEPFAINVVRFGGQALSEAEEMVELAIRTWDVCMKRGEWPGYDIEDGTAIDPAFWRSSQKELRRLALQHRIDRWQRPLEIAGDKAA
jgi:hypothetical protein